VVKQLGLNCTLLALADPEQRIFDFIGADPARLDHFREAFRPVETDLSTENHRSKGTEIALFGNEVLHGRYSKSSYVGVDFVPYPPNLNQAYTTLITQTLQARKRLLKDGPADWSLAVLVPTKKLTRLVSDNFRAPIGNLPQIYHTAAVDMEGPVLAAEIVAYLMQPDGLEDRFHGFVELVCSFYQGKDGNAPSTASLREAESIRAARNRGVERAKGGKAKEKKSVTLAMRNVYDQVRTLALTGDPDIDWRSIRATLEKGTCPRLQIVAKEVRNVRLLERGTQLRQALSEDWRNKCIFERAFYRTRSFCHRTFRNSK
jgi:DNA helicase-2/ATP-dependent DNA helicase PcrA